MAFQNERDLADENFLQMGKNLGFTHNVSRNSFACYISVKNCNKTFDGDLEAKKSNKLFEKYDLVSEGWSIFRSR